MRDFGGFGVLRVIFLHGKCIIFEGWRKILWIEGVPDAKHICGCSKKKKLPGGGVALASGWVKNCPK